uniref:Uncharacterized protein n=1 Tax=Accipiter nisus TaxID=211598 RepID=A0A8B9N8N3_9AVES
RTVFKYKEMNSSKASNFSGPLQLCKTKKETVSLSFHLLSENNLKKKIISTGKNKSHH